MTPSSPPWTCSASSTSSCTTRGGGAAASATKGAIHAFTKSLAQNLVERKIRVNAVAPGPIWTPLNVVDKPAKKAKKAAKKAAKHGAETPTKRPGRPEELAPAYLFVASNSDSSYTPARY